ncbi:MAG TPA: phosphatidylinositol mannoside acyltransferase [Acidimicrobiia bacterium]|nr:phosphatidylinositol mannoside acyltransferase [Acidimicrobiia bacterium]
MVDRLLEVLAHLPTAQVTEALRFGLFRLGIGLVGLLPSGVVRRLGTLGGRIWGRFATGRRRIARRHMQRVLGPSADIDRAVGAMFGSYGRYWAETFWVRPRRVAEIDRGLSISGLKYLEKAGRAGTGAILVLPHLGNWEPAALSGRRAGIEIAAVAERLPNQRLTEWFVSMRAQYGITIIPHGRTSMRNVEAAIRRGAAVALLCDRDLSGRGVQVTFFGEETTLPAGPAALALKTGAPIVTAATFFDGDGHRVDIDELPLDGVDDVRDLTQRIAIALEGIIRQAPEQWHLFQPNWPSDRQS